MLASALRSLPQSIRSSFNRRILGIGRYRKLRVSPSDRLNRSVHPLHKNRPTRPRLVRTLTCYAIVVNLLIWPSPQITFGAIAAPVSEAASAVQGAVADVMTTLRTLPEVIVPFRPMMFPLLPFWPRQAISPVARELSVADRTSRVASLKVSPHKLVAYIGDAVTFVAMGTDAQGQPAHGAKIEWESSDSNSSRSMKPGAPVV
jgi:hypothetical protein